MIKQPVRPKSRGRIWVTPGIQYLREVRVEILGDPEGLEYLAEVMKYVSEIDQRTACVPRGERYRLRLDPGVELEEYSCYVDIIRADATGTGEYPEGLSLEDERNY